MPTGGEARNHPQVWPWLSGWRALGEAGRTGARVWTGQGVRGNFLASLWDPGILVLLPTSSSCQPPTLAQGGALLTAFGTQLQTPP